MCVRVCEQCVHCSAHTCFPLVVVDVVLCHVYCVDFNWRVVYLLLYLFLIRFLFTVEILV